MTEVQIKIYGIVQGVSFRYYTREESLKLDLTGWVKNLPSGTVEILAQGEKENLEKLISWTKEGPRSARVESVETNWRVPKESFSSFEIRY